MCCNDTFFGIGTFQNLNGSCNSCGSNGVNIRFLDSNSNCGCNNGCGSNRSGCSSCGSNRSNGCGCNNCNSCGCCG